LEHDRNLVACMTFSKSAPDRNRILEDGYFSLSRFAVAGSIPGAASKLYKNSVEVLKAQHIVTYSDNRYASGAVYTSLGFSLDAEIDPDYRVWHTRYGICHKSFWQRRMIQSRLDDLGIKDTFAADDPRTEFDMEELCGCRLLWDCGKKRWIWKAPSAVITV
jgi:hypothetical protein